jgi:hypothetical protein
MKKPATDKPQRTHLSSAIWATIRALWESNQGTFKELAAQFGTSGSTIKHRSSRERWGRQGLAPAVEEKIRQETVAMLAELGMPKKEFLKLIIEGAKATNNLKNVKRAYKDDTGKTIMQGQKPIVVEQTITVEDNALRLEYRREIAKLAGWYAPGKVPIPPEDEDDTIPIIPHENLLADMPKKEPECPPK